MIKQAQQSLPTLPLHRMCQLLGLSRSLVYRNGTEKQKEMREDARLVEAIDALTLAFAGYGYRRVTAQLVREGWSINHKRVLRVMRENGLLCRLKKRWIQTTDSGHGLKTYPNLLQGKKASDISGLNQVWVSDITYVRLPNGFCYVAAVLDAFSRRVVGWHASSEIDSALVLAALEKALTERTPEAGWIHHSDQGVQYACRRYVERLESAEAQISMSRKGRPRDNAQAESFFRTLKVEEVYLQDYENLAQVRACVGQFIEAVYNQKRLHSSLGYLPPAEFEENEKQKANNLLSENGPR